jgi:hypothetical protein
MVISIHLTRATTATMAAMKHSTHVYDIRKEEFLVGKI